MRLPDLIDAVDTPGGHIVGLLALLYTMLALAVVGRVYGFEVPKTEDIIIGTYGALLAKLSGARSNAERLNGTGKGTTSPAKLPITSSMSIG